MTTSDSNIQVPLSQGFITSISPEDADLCSRTWYAFRTKYGVVYAAQNNWVKDRGEPMLLHRFILERVLGRTLLRHELVDHKDLDGLNNIRGNLRLASASQNHANAKPPKDNKSGYKGVSWHTRVGCWRAVITKNKRQHHLGYFDTPEEAHEAYKKAALELFGEFARFE